MRLPVLRSSRVALASLLLVGVAYLASCSEAPAAAEYADESASLLSVGLIAFGRVISEVAAPHG